MSDDDTFGAELRRLRTERGWTLYRLAKESGIELSLIGRYERGNRRPRRPSVDRLAAALALSAEERAGLLRLIEWTDTLPDPDVAAVARILADPRTPDRTRAAIRGALGRMIAMAGGGGRGG